MKVHELLAEAKKVERKVEGRLDKQNLRRDYVRWRKLVNMPTKMVRIMAGIEDNAKRGMTKRELEKKYGFSMPKTAAAAIIRMRTRPPSEWATIDINWMYRMLRYIERKLARKQTPLVDNKKPSDKLQDLWAWGHIPRNLKPTSKEFRDSLNVSKEKKKT